MLPIGTFICLFVHRKNVVFVSNAGFAYESHAYIHFYLSYLFIELFSSLFKYRSFPLPCMPLVLWQNPITRNSHASHVQMGWTILFNFCHNNPRECSI